MRYSVIACLYNTIGCVKPALESLFPLPADAELVLVDNCGPDNTVMHYAVALQAEHPEQVKIVRPGKNLGCHAGWNFGFKYSTGKYVLKYDDDTVLVMKDNWLAKMSDALERNPQLAFLSADLDPAAKQQNKYLNVRFAGNHSVEVPQSGIVGFSCVMFRREDMERWGGLKCGAYRYAASKEVCKDEGLYGGEEVYVAQMAKAEGKTYGHYPAVLVHHLGNEERNYDYVFWKRVYGYYGWTHMDMSAWIASGEYVDHYARAMMLELKSTTPNDCLLVEWLRRLKEIGKKHHLMAVNACCESENGVVRSQAIETMEAISEREVK